MNWGEAAIGGAAAVLALGLGVTANAAMAAAPRLDPPQSPYGARSGSPSELTSQALAERLIAEVEAMTPTEANRRRLNQLLDNNNYRLPELTFRQQNNYYAAIMAKRGDLKQQADAQKCAPLADPLVPRELKGAIVLLGGYTEPLTQVVCSAQAASGDARLAKPRLGASEHYVLTAGDLMMTFKLGRAVEGAFVGLSAPLKGGTLALAPTEVKVGAGRARPINGWQAADILTARFQPALSAFLAQAKGAR